MIVAKSREVTLSEGGPKTIVFRLDDDNYINVESVLSLRAFP